MACKTCLVATSVQKSQDLPRIIYSWLSSILLFGTAVTKKTALLPAKWATTSYHWGYGGVYKWPYKSMGFPGVLSPYLWRLQAHLYMVYRVPSCRNPFSENPYLRPFSNADGLEDELPGFPFKRPGWPIFQQGYVCCYFQERYITVYIPGTQMTVVLNGKGLLLEGSNPKIEDKQVPGK